MINTYKPAELLNIQDEFGSCFEAWKAPMKQRVHIASYGITVNGITRICRTLVNKDVLKTSSLFNGLTSYATKSVFWSTLYR